MSKPRCDIGSCTDEAVVKTQCVSTVLPKLMFCVLHGAVVQGSQIVALSTLEPKPGPSLDPQRTYSVQDDNAFLGEADPHDPNCWSNQ
jgi:hypothetical protein